MTQEPISNEEIDAALDGLRPDRYNVDDHAWRAPVVKLVAGRITQAQARQLAAERIVSQRESGATRSVNRLLRKIALERQFPIEGSADDLRRRPMSVGAERVCLAMAGPDDFRQWAIDERRDAAQDFSARSSACDGAEWVAGAMEDKGFDIFAEALDEGQGKP